MRVCVCVWVYACVCVCMCVCVCVRVVVCELWSFIRAAYVTFASIPLVKDVNVIHDATSAILSV